MGAPERRQDLDIAKGLGIILVVCGHITNDGWYTQHVVNTIYSFHIPLFFFLSGLLFRQAPPAELIRKRFASLVVPYFKHFLVLLAITWLLYAVFAIDMGATKMTVAGFFVLPFVHGHQLPLYDAAWFVTQLFLAQALFSVLLYVCQGEESRIGWRLLLAVAALYAAACHITTTYESVINDKLWLPVLRTMYCTAYVFCGYAAQTYRVRFRSASVLLLALGAEALIVASHGGGISLETVWMGFTAISAVPYLALLLALAGIYPVLFAAAALAQSPAGNILAHIGRRSFAVMCYHLFIFFLLNAIFYARGDIGDEQLSAILYAYNPRLLLPVYVALGVGLPVLWSWLTDRLQDRAAKRAAHAADA